MINRSSIPVLVCIFGMVFLNAQDDSVYNFTRDDDPDFGISVNVSDSGSEQTYNLALGFSPDATDGYDDAFDAYAPPAPPSGFDAALTWNNDRFYTQVVNGSADDLTEHVFGIAMIYVNHNIITWDNTGWRVCADKEDGVVEVATSL